MKKKIAIALSLALVMSMALTACGGGGDKSGATSTPAVSNPATSQPAASNPAEPSGVQPKDGGTSLTFTTGGDQGTYYGFGGVLGGKVGETTSTTVTAVPSGGSKSNIDTMELEDAQLGFVQSDVMAYAYNGERLFEEKVDCFSTVAALYMEQVQIVTLNPDIKTVADLKGKSVSIGDQGSGVYFNAIDVLGAYDLTEADIKPQYLSFGDSAENLQDGKIDAAFVVAGAPTTAVTTLAASNDVYLVSLDDEHIDKLIASSPYYSKNVIPKTAYNTPDDVTTVAVGAVVIARNDVSDADVYNFLYGVFENIDTLGHDKAKELSLEFASSVTAVPYHPGAVAYFADKGITVK